MKNEKLIPNTIDGFEIQREIGTGAVGTVYEAIQKSSGRKVALKLISSQHGLMSQALMRLRPEIKLLMRLEHPHIVPVFSYGEFGLVAYLTMELVSGPSLSDVIRASKLERAGIERSIMPDSPYVSNNDIESVLELLQQADSASLESATNEQQLANTSRKAPENPSLKSFRKIAVMMADIADALAYSHGNGVIHRSLNPANLLFSPDGKLKLTDFSIANLLEQPGMTLFGAIINSPMYMSPEQIKASAGQLDHRTDIYSLGATLYEWITLRPPFEGKYRHEIVANVIAQEPVRPRKINRQIPRSIETVCLKAMDADPGKRYQTADQMAEDLRRFASNRRIKARPVGPVTKSSRWLNKHRSLSSAILAGVLLVGVLGTFAYGVYSARRKVYVQLLETRINDAIVSTFAGDQQVPLSAMKKLEYLGPNEWVTAMLSGQYLLYSGKPNEAVDELKRALSLNANSLEIKTELGNALRESQRLDELSVLSDELATAVPVSTREELFLGRWIAEQEPERGLQIIRDVFSITKPELDNLARLILSRARWQVALDNFDVENAEDARIESQFSYYYFRYNSYAVANDYQSSLVAAVVLREANRITDAEELELTSGNRLRELEEQYPDSRSAALASSWQAYSIDDTEARIHKFQNSIAKCVRRGMQVPGDLQEAYVLELLLGGRSSEAKQEFESLKSTNVNELEFLLVMLLAEDADLDLEAAQRALAALPLPKGMAAIHRPVGLQILGKTEEAQRLYEQIRDSIALPLHRQAWLRKLIDYGCGSISTQELIASMDEQGISHFNRSQGHYFIGIKLLSEGKRREATQHFEECLQAHVFPSREHQLARFVLKQLKLDSNWPTWLPASDSSVD